ncbi:MAG: hypothetical protein K2X43_14140 [Hyphomonadaceae bacterium]|nr:hypothetical protein [Hyphomonadaceae bacterium]
MAGLGFISGAASAGWGTFAGSNLERLQPVAIVFGLAPELLPIGFYFGVVIALGVWMWGGRWWSVPVLLVTTMYAWSAAIQVAIRTQTHMGDAAHLIAASLGAGAVGAGLTQLGGALFAPGLRRPLRLAATCGVGAIAGLLFYLGERKVIDERLLYLVWQPAVAFCIGWGLAAGRRDA